MTKDITESELLDAIQAALESDTGAAGLEPGTITAPRLAEQFEISENAARAILKRMYKEGKVSPAKVMYTDAWGYRQRVKGWRLDLGK